MPGKAPNADSLYEAAMNHLARYAATETGLARVLSRRIDRWGQKQATELSDMADELPRLIRGAKAEIPGIITRLKELGLLNDAAFVSSRAKRLTRAGKSHRATLAHLAAKGVSSPDLPEDPQRELAAACAYLRRRRAGPFGETKPEKILAAMARGGFSRSISHQAIALDWEEAENLIKSLDTPLP
ncbi:regulatory protein RecX [Acidocella sp.]|uniref:regulatory protein RecX n=1 Tax=Acidocella sp. TaxID=50710 RepID=UPI003CFE7537